MLIDSVTICFVVRPLTLVSVTFNVGEFSVATRFVIFPLSNVARAIWPCLWTETITKSADPFAVVDRASLISVRISLLARSRAPAASWRLFKLHKDKVASRSNLLAFQKFYLFSSKISSSPGLKFDNYTNITLNESELVFFTHISTQFWSRSVRAKSRLLNQLTCWLVKIRSVRSALHQSAGVIARFII